ncbi:EVE domain-containing protein [Niallia taxi]|uniref:EVE domain-containing protein n=1 Tax=Niallia taxi TaxID=2499688 RepID=UPI002E22B7EE|nr:EVE domain-containing protein [Niallia taxi]MED4122279.1 EVE domain-containing protein [Niallia taxi]
MQQFDDVVTTTVKANSRYWIGVVSEEHVKRGENGGFAQLCHGKSAPLRKMKKGDWLVYYSPKTSYPKGTPLQAFTAIGQVKTGDVYQYEMTPDFIPHRIDVAFRNCTNVSLKSLKPELNFMKEQPNVGLLFRRGHFEISKEDFVTIAEAMGVNVHGVGI